MTHSQYTAVMSLVLDHAASPEQVQDLHRHLAVCPGCAGAWARWRALDRRLAAAPRLAAPPGFSLRVAARIEAQRLARRRRWWIGSSVLLVWGGLLSALWITLGLLVLWGVVHPAETGTLLADLGQRLSGVTAFFNTLGPALAELWRWPLPLGIVTYVAITAAVASLWLWLVYRASAQTGQPARASES